MFVAVTFKHAFSAPKQGVAEWAENAYPIWLRMNTWARIKSARFWAVFMSPLINLNRSAVPAKLHSGNLVRTQHVAERLFTTRELKCAAWTRYNCFSSTKEVRWTCSIDIKNHISRKAAPQWRIIFVKRTPSTQKFYQFYRIVSALDNVRFRPCPL